MIETELVRRDQIRDEIAALDEDQREEAFKNEKKRKLDWKNARAEYRRTGGTQTVGKEQDARRSRKDEWRSKVTSMTLFIRNIFR